MELRKLWKEVEKRYQMHLAAWERGLSGEIDWVHIIESLQVAEFLRGGELVLTTGMQGKEEQLLKLGKKLWQKEACGLVVNLGPYIKEIPQPGGASGRRNQNHLCYAERIRHNREKAHRSGRECPVSQPGSRDVSAIYEKVRLFC